MAFVKAEREKAYLRLGLSGVTGSGKTYSSLLLGTKIASLTNTRVGLIDSEQRSSLFYAERKKGGQLVGFDFDHSELNSSDPLEYVNEIKAAKAAGYGVLIIDSMTHAWNFILDYNEKLAQRAYKGNTWSAWSKTIPLLYAPLMTEILKYPGHIIATFRSKTESAIENENGKNFIKKMGMKNEYKPGIEYEFSMFFQLDEFNQIHCTKDRLGLFKGKDLPAANEQLALDILEDLNSGKAEYKEINFIDNTKVELKEEPSSTNNGNKLKKQPQQQGKDQKPKREPLQILKEAIKVKVESNSLDEIKSKTIPGWDKYKNDKLISPNIYKEGKKLIDNAIKEIEQAIRKNKETDQIEQPSDSGVFLEYVKQEVSNIIEQGLYEELETLENTFKEKKSLLPDHKKEIDILIKTAKDKMGVF